MLSRVFDIASDIVLLSFSASSSPVVAYKVEDCYPVKIRTCNPRKQAEAQALDGASTGIDNM